MRIAIAVSVLLVLPAIGAGKGATTRIEIARGKTPVLTLAGEQSAGQFTIWSGPGTSMTAADGTVSTPEHPGDIARWSAGPVERPRRLQVYQVRFYCAAGAIAESAASPSHQCYGVRYAIDARSGQGYIQIPPANDAEFPLNQQTILRGVEGSWFRASDRWEELVRPQLDAALTTQREPAHRRDQPYIHVPAPPPASRTAVGARSTVPTKPR
jgi:hypothetical protein